MSRSCRHPKIVFMDLVVAVSDCDKGQCPVKCSNMDDCKKRQRLKELEDSIDHYLPYGERL